MVLNNLNSQLCLNINSKRILTNKYGQIKSIYLANVNESNMRAARSVVENTL